MNVIKAAVFLGSSLADWGKYMYALEKMTDIIKIMWWLKIRESLPGIRQPRVSMYKITLQHSIEAILYIALLAFVIYNLVIYLHYLLTNHLGTT